MVLSVGWEPQFLSMWASPWGFWSVLPGRVTNRPVQKPHCLLWPICWSHILSLSQIFWWLHKAPSNPLSEGNTQSRYYQSSSWVWLLTWLFLYVSVGAGEFYNYICALQGWLQLIFYWIALIWRIKFKPLRLAWTPASLLLPLPLFHISYVNKLGKLPVSSTFLF